MNSLYKFIIGAYLLIGSTSCGYLDVVPDNIATIDYAFQDRAAAEKFLFTCYNYMPSQANSEYDPAMFGGGEFYSYIGLNPMERKMLSIVTGKVDLGNIVANYWNGEGSGKPLYQGIRDCNIFLEKIDMPYDILPHEKKRWIAEVKFLKAYYHFYLMRLYGSISIIDKNLPVSTPANEMHIYREPFDDCVTYVSDLLDEAAVDLPLVIEKEASELGRITKPIALAVKAKLLTLSASPLFNGNADYSGVIDNRNIKLFNPEYDATKWELAANACKAAIDVAHEAKRELFKPVNIPFVLNDRLKQDFSLRQVIWAQWNSELIWGSNSMNMGRMQVLTVPKLQAGWSGNNNLKQQFSPTLDVVESYYTNNGVPMSEDHSFPYDNRYKLTTTTAQEEWYIAKDFQTVNLHLNREPRFYASVAFDGSIWWGTGRVDQSKELYTIAAKRKQNAGVISNANYSSTGYFAKKLVSYETIVPDGTSPNLVVKTSPFPIIRLADLYLLYAEALNESKAAPNQDVYEYIDKVRVRAGLEGVVASWSKHSRYPDKPLTKDGMRSIIQQERLIELAMEGHRMYDIRRWKRGIEMWNKTFKGWNILGEDAEDYYRLVDLQDNLNFMQKNYLWPISEYDITVNGNLKQNYGW